jgi:hypothetical protein
MVASCYTSEPGEICLLLVEFVDWSGDSYHPPVSSGSSDSFVSSKNRSRYAILITSIEKKYSRVCRNCGSLKSSNFPFKKRR